MLWWRCSKRILNLHGALRNVSPQASTSSARLPVICSLFYLEKQWRIILVLYGYFGDSSAMSPVKFCISSSSGLLKQR